MNRLPAFLIILVGCSSSTAGAEGLPPAAANAEGDPAPSAAMSPAAAMSGDTWTSYAAGFFTTYCNSCHGPSDDRNYEVREGVDKDKLDIRCGVALVQDRSWSCAAFPPAAHFPIGRGPRPTDAERNRLVAWVTAGAP
jgi:hypothetical protein